MPGTDSADPGDPPIPTFTLFPSLPAELRLKIWQLSFLPRVVELHKKKTHYADDDRFGGQPKWQSRSPNPIALAVNAEARAAALEHFTVALPLTLKQESQRAGAGWLDLHRKLYFSPSADTLVVFGDLDMKRMIWLLKFISSQDPRGPGLQRLAISASCFALEGSEKFLKIYAKTIFKDLDELVLFMYEELQPPDDWNDGACELVDCSGKDYYRRFSLGRGARLKAGSDWMTVGKKKLSVMDLVFQNGDKSQKFVLSSSRIPRRSLPEIGREWTASLA